MTLEARDRILEKLRRGLPVTPAPLPGVRDDATHFTPASGDLAGVEPRIEHLGRRLEHLGAEFHPVEDVLAAGEVLGRILADLDPAKCLAPDVPLLREVVEASPLPVGEILREEKDLALDSPSLAGFEASLTPASAVVVRTGSILVTSRGAGGRRLSVLPPLHVVVAGVSQLVDSLDEAFAGLEGDDSSSVSLITGPSRTADIEKILVLGAHGPKRLALILIASN